MVRQIVKKKFVNNILSARFSIVFYTSMVLFVSYIALVRYDVR